MLSQNQHELSPARQGGWVLTAAIVASGMSSIDATAVNVILPLLQRELHASAASLQWIVEGYALLLSALLLVGGALGDRYGRRLVFSIGVSIFAITSALCAIASTLPVLIAARCLQGVGGALLTPGSLALISANFHKEARGRAIGTWSGVSAITAAGGPVLGGWLAQAFSWRYVFLINLPLAAGVLAACIWRVPESRNDAAPHHVDVTGASLATVSLGLLVYGLIRMQTGQIEWLGGAAVLTGALLLIGFVFYERRAKHPMIPMSLFASRVFTGANLYTLLLYAALGGCFFYVPFNLINVQHYTPVAAGAALLPIILLISLASRWSGGLVARIGARTPLIAGAVIAAVGFAAFARPGLSGTYWTTFFPAACILGVGGALFVAPLTTTVMDAVDATQAGVASGINNAVARTAGLIAIAALGIVLAGNVHTRFDHAMRALPVNSHTLAVLTQEHEQLAAGMVPAAIEGPDRALVSHALQQSYVDGFRVVMFACAMLALGSALIARVTLPRSAPEQLSPHTE